MHAYAARRLLQLLPTLAGVAVVAFVLMRMMPGDPTVMAGQTISEEVRLELRRQWHLDSPLPVQFYHYVRGLPVLDLGVSMRLGMPVRELVAGYFANTAILAVVALLISVVAGVGLGALAGLWRGTWVDRAVIAVSLAGISVPVFVVGVLLMLGAVAVRWRFFGGTGDPFDIRYVLLPALALGTRSIATMARVTRSAVVEAATADHVRTARAKGLSPRAVALRHVLRNALVPVVTIVGLNFGDYLAGAVLVESIFQWPGLGMLIRNAIAFRDLPVLLGAVLVTTTVFVLVNFAVDLLYAALDPRVRVGGGSGA